YSVDGQSYPKGVWVRQVRAQKTSKSIGIHQTIIPNRVFPNGTTFYQHIECYLEGVWWPLSKPSPKLTPSPYQGSNPRYHGTQGVWMTAGRATFNPKDTEATDVQGNVWRVGHLFVTPTRGLPYNEIAYIEAIRCNSHRLIGKPITPHTMRYFWATWGWQVGLSDTELRSLAYMMGHSVETLRRMYMKMTPIEKQQPIEDAINARLCRPDGDEDIIPLNKLLRAVHHLKKDERYVLLQHMSKISDSDRGEITPA
ncbi:MAG: hypothetical protein VKL39_15980, partial [Leptolyngbyaceae bacterium]|nr:hypothetical protein [Leptolyngbyaceae bacterium]